MHIRTLHLVEALPGSGKTRREIIEITKSTHNRFLYVCKGLNQIDDAVNDLLAIDNTIVVKPFKSDEMVFGSVVESIQKYMESIDHKDQSKHVVVITQNAYVRFNSIKFIDDCNFWLSWDEKLDEFCVDIKVAYDNQTRPEHIRVIKDGKVTLSPIAEANLASKYNLRSLKKTDVNTLITYINHGMYDVYYVIDKSNDDELIEYYQAYIKPSFFPKHTRILSYGLIDSPFHKFLEKTFTDTTITTERMKYDHRDHTITVTPMTKKRNTNYIQTHYAPEYERMMHKMFELALAQNGKTMCYVNKIHDGIAEEYTKKNVSIKLPNYLHGLNDYRDYDVLVTTFASNRSPESVMGLVNKLEMDRNELLTERTKDALIQVAQRGVTRNYDVTGRHMKIYVVSLEDAEHIKETLPNVTIDMTYINQSEFTFNKKASKPTPPTSKERKLISKIKKNGTLGAPQIVQYVLKQNKDLKCAAYKEVLVKAKIWDKFSPSGRWIGE